MQDITRITRWKVKYNRQFYHSTPFELIDVNKKKYDTLLYIAMGLFAITAIAIVINRNKKAEDDT